MIINNVLSRQKVRPYFPNEHVLLRVRGFGSSDASVTTTMFVNGKEIPHNLTYEDDDYCRVYYNSYDDYFPYNLMKEVEKGDNKFIEALKMYIAFEVSGATVVGFDISNRKLPTFIEMPAFYGRDKVLYGKYQASSETESGKLQSVSGKSVRFNRTRAQFRSQASDNGAGYHQMGLFEWQLLQFLMTHYFGTTNSDNYFPDISGAEVGTGIMDGYKTAYRLSDGKNVFFGIENIIKNGWHFLDGININNRTNYLNYDFTTWEDDTTTNYLNVGSSPSSGDWIISFSLRNNNTLAVYSATSSGGETKYFADRYYENTGWRVLRGGSRWGSGTNRGLFYWYAAHDSGDSTSYGGSRLNYSPPL